MKFFIRDFFARLYMLLCRVYPVNEKRIVFKSDRGVGCSDSPFALFQELKKSYPDYEAIWVLKDLSKRPENAIAVKESSLSEMKALATSKYWIDNKRKGCWAIKRKGQKYVQTWHGPIALKKVEKDIEDKLPPYYVKSAKHDSAIADYFLSSSKWTTSFYRSCFWYKGEILEFGVPRSDVFYKKPIEEIRDIRDHFGVSDSCHIVLYAPTFRDDGNVDVFALDYERLISTLEKKFGGDWKVIVRLHPNLTGIEGIVHYNENVLNGNTVGDISNIILACDVLITDYSSCMYDAMEAGKTVFLYAPDIDVYGKDRGFVMPLTDLPFSIGEDIDELCAVIENFKNDKYIERVKEFSTRIGIFDNGSASEKVLNFLLSQNDQ